MKYFVMVWYANQFVGESRWFKTLTEAHFFINRSGAIRGILEDAYTGETLETFGD